MLSLILRAGLSGGDMVFVFAYALAPFRQIRSWSRVGGFGGLRGFRAVARLRDGPVSDSRVGDLVSKRGGRRGG